MYVEIIVLIFTKNAPNLTTFRGFTYPHYIALTLWHGYIWLLTVLPSQRRNHKLWFSPYPVYRDIWQQYPFFFSPSFLENGVRFKYRKHFSPLNCPSSKGNHAPTQKFERNNGKNRKSIFFFKSVQNLCPLSHLKALWSEFFEDLNPIKSKQIKTNENQWRFWSFYI